MSGRVFLVECGELFEGKGCKGENLTPAIDKGRLPVGARAARKKTAALLPEAVVVDLAEKFNAGVRRDVGAHEQLRHRLRAESGDRGKQRLAGGFG